MPFVDRLFEFYRNKLTGEEVDAELIAVSILDELDREDIISLLQEMDDQELFGLFGFYLAEGLKARMSREELNPNPLPAEYSSKLIH